MGYNRGDGLVGTANYWLVIPMVFCENGNVEIMRNSMVQALGLAKRSQYERFAEELAKTYTLDESPEAVTLAEQVEDAQSPVFPNLDGVKFLTHGLGCGETRGISNELCGLLAGYACNPNVAGITVLSLVQQHAQVSILEKEISQRSPTFNKPLLVFEQQKYTSEREMMEQAIRQTLQVLPKPTARSEHLPLYPSCAWAWNAALRWFFRNFRKPGDWTSRRPHRGFGRKGHFIGIPRTLRVEQEIVNRCIDRKTGDRFIEIMRNYEERVKEAGSGFHMNPSPGNVKDGLVTDAIKSAGAARKGEPPPVDALDYPGWVTRRVFLLHRRNDVESTTAMAGAGANLMLFSTGLGTNR